MENWYEKLRLKFVYCHFLDICGIPIKKAGLLDESFLKYTLISSYFLATADVSLFRVKFF